VATGTGTLVKHEANFFAVLIFLLSFFSPFFFFSSWHWAGKLRKTMTDLRIVDNVIQIEVALPKHYCKAEELAKCQRCWKLGLVLPRLEWLWGTPNLLKWVRGALTRGWSGRRVKLTTHLHLVPRLIKHGAIPPLPSTSSRCGN
jgi:hypothetical protein